MEGLGKKVLITSAVVTPIAGVSWTTGYFLNRNIHASDGPAATVSEFLSDQAENLMGGFGFSSLMVLLFLTFCANHKGVI